MAIIYSPAIVRLNSERARATFILAFVLGLSVIGNIVLAIKLCQARMFPPARSESRAYMENMASYDDGVYDANHNKVEDNP